MDRAVGFHAVIAQIGKVVDVDQHLRRGEPELQHRDQALAAGENLGVAAPVGEKRPGLFDRTWRFVAESSGVDGGPPCVLLSAPRLFTPVRRGFSVRLGIGHGDRERLRCRIRPRLLMRRPGALYRLPCHFEIVDDLGPGPDGGALPRLGGVLDQLEETRIAPTVT
jgi:hypothetical protein